MDFIIDPKKDIKNLPKRPEVKRPVLTEMTKDELMNFAAERLIGMMATFDANLYRSDTAYHNEFNIQFMWGVSAYSMLGLRDIQFPIELFLEEYGKSLNKVKVRKRILD
jgi:hypothetical protein